MELKPNFGEMSGSELVEAYVKLTGRQRSSKFSTRAQGVEACEAAWSKKVAASAGEPVEDGDGGDRTPTRPLADARDRHTVVNGTATGRSSSPAPTVEEVEREKPEPRAKPAKGGSGQDARLERKVTLTVPHNPKKEGTEGHRHFEVLRKSQTVGAYYGAFEPGRARRNAAQWLSNFVREGSARIGG